MGCWEAGVGCRPDGCLGKPRDAGSAEDGDRRGYGPRRKLIGHFAFLKNHIFDRRRAGGGRPPGPPAPRGRGEAPGLKPRGAALTRQTIKNMTFLSNHAKTTSEHLELAPWTVPSPQEPLPSPPGGPRSEIYFFPLCLHTRISCLNLSLGLLTT